jgi:hypothetical protein
MVIIIVAVIIIIIIIIIKNKIYVNKIYVNRKHLLIGINIKRFLFILIKKNRHLVDQRNI